MSDLRRGDRVHVEFDGVVGMVVGQARRCWDVEVDLPDGTHTFVRREHVSAIEPEPPVIINIVCNCDPDKIAKRITDALVNYRRHHGQRA